MRENFKPVQEATFAWAFGDAKPVRDAFGPWFGLVMRGMVPTPVIPKTLTPKELGKIRSPTLVYLGTKDQVVGDARPAAELARNIPGVEIRLVETGHLMGAEMAGQINEQIMSFFAEK